MRLGGPLFEPYLEPDSWVTALKRSEYRAAYCPELKGGYTPKDFANAARAADILIAEVGVWNNPLSRDDATRKEAIRLCQEKLTLADEIGAACCVNIAGSRGSKWDGPHPDDLTPETFDLIVGTVRVIIDAVKPKRTFYTLETMPWMYPDSTESYLQLINAIDRPSFAVHFDPVNLICSPQRYFNNAALIGEFIAVLGPRIKSVHAKDIILRDHLTTHLDEVCPGLGALNYRNLLRELNHLDANIPLMVEHLPGEAEYRQATAYLRGVAAEIDVSL
jgi:sugar phosphate isomerase/epimerase